MGHEGAGVVEALGEGVEGLNVGDRVVVNYVNPDGSCPMCRRGREDVCERLPMGFGTDGVFAEALAIPARNVAVLPEAVPFDEGAILGCAGATAYRATSRSDLRPGMSCMIIGLGGVGMQAVPIAKLFGASPLVAVDVRDAKLALAKRLGADLLVNAAKEDPGGVARSLGDGRGVGLAFDYIGLAKTLMATQGHTNQDLREVIDLRARGLLRTAETITHHLPFREIDKGIEILESQKGDLVRIALHH